MLDYKNALNPEQYEAVTSTEGALLIIAGAGSGKTRVITYRIAYLLDKGVPQSQILALTFTNKAAREMSDRVREITRKKLQNLTVSTFHSFGVKILRESCGRLGWRENFSIYDEVDRNQLIKETARELKITGKEKDSFDVIKTAALFSNIKTERWYWGDDARVFAAARGDEGEKFIGYFPMYDKLYEEYQANRKIYNSFDFDDLIVMPVELLKTFPDVREAYQNRYRYILVDEFQDTSVQQYDLTRLLSAGNIAVVGDDDQSIYSWRGANYENIRMFERDFPHLKEIRLLQNYRSTETILAAANGVIAHNTNRKDKELWSGNGSGKPIELYYPDDENDEADFIAETILKLRSAEKLRYEDFGVLMRANTQSRPLEEAFLSENIPYVMSGGLSFFARKEIKDVISYLRVCANPDDDVNLLRVINTPRRGIGKKTVEAVNAVTVQHKVSLWKAIKLLMEKHGEDDLLFDDGESEDTAEETGIAGFVKVIEEGRKKLFSQKNLSKNVRVFLESINYSDYLMTENQSNEKAMRAKLLNVESLLSSIADWEENEDEPTLYNYLNRITLLSRDDMNTEEGGKVNLMTIHAAKGLEFPVVFIAGAEDGLIPHERSLEENESNIEEERRLFYVAITRARDKLFISSCKKRKKMQSVAECEPSRFLSEIPAELVENFARSNEPVSAEKASLLLEQMRARLVAK
ncbi:MAG: UvrD-helicase domain-containing protein [Treponemataceae bacterium]|nr:MAG: UvrD-helicase domain-containing protein [Treponemataceae bacterium]